MAWRVARSLDVLLGQINKAYPRRSTRSDGSIGDAAHASRKSDHNPWVKFPGSSIGIVTARDFTHDPDDGFDAHEFAEHLRKARDPRIKYVISNRRIFAGNDGPRPWVWRPYKGPNPHTKHIHVSVRPYPSSDSVTPWRMPQAEAASRVPQEEYMIARGERGNHVRVVQKCLMGWNPKALPKFGADKDFGAETEKWVKAYQRAADLPVTGRVDGVTLALLVRYAK